MLCFFSLRCRKVERGSKFRSAVCPADSFLPACSQNSSSIHTPPLRLLPHPYGTHRHTNTKLACIIHGCNKFEQLHTVSVCVFVSRVVLRWHCSVTGRHWRQTPGVYVLCIRACSSTDSWATHRLRYKLSVCCIQWVTRVHSTHRAGRKGMPLNCV